MLPANLQRSRKPSYRKVLSPPVLSKRAWHAHCLCCNVIRVSQSHPRDRETVFRIEGRLDAEAVNELRSIVQSRPPRSIGLDLTGLGSVDGAGQKYLAELRAAGVSLRGASLYITRLLEEA